MRLLQYFLKSPPSHFRKGRKKINKLKAAPGYESPAFFHIFITIKWQFKQRNEYCILIGVICSRISCMIHAGGDHRWVTRRAAAAADASGGSGEFTVCTVTMEDGVRKYLRLNIELSQLRLYLNGTANRYLSGWFVGLGVRVGFLTTNVYVCVQMH